MRAKKLPAGVGWALHSHPFSAQVVIMDHGYFKL